jgi:hypothetical protein
VGFDRLRALGTAEEAEVKRSVSPFLVYKGLEAFHVENMFALEPYNVLIL